MPRRKDPKNGEVSDRSKIPARFMPLLGNPPTINDEDPDRYYEMLAEMGASLGAKDLVDWCLAETAANCAWYGNQLRAARSRLLESWVIQHKPFDNKAINDFLFGEVRNVEYEDLSQDEKVEIITRKFREKLEQKPEFGIKKLSTAALLIDVVLPSVNSMVWPWPPLLLVKTMVN